MKPSGKDSRSQLAASWDHFSIPSYSLSKLWQNMTDSPASGSSPFAFGVMVFNASVDVTGVACDNARSRSDRSHHGYLAEEPAQTNGRTAAVESEARLLPRSTRISYNCAPRGEQLQPERRSRDFSHWSGNVRYCRRLMRRCCSQ